MLTVTDKYKVGRATIYICNDDNGNRVELDKDKIQKEIENKNVRNASIQIYKGLVIIRVHNIKSTTTVTQKKQTDTKNTKPRSITKKETKLVLDEFKNILEDFNIQNIDDALAFAFEHYEFDLDISTLDKVELANLRFEMASDIKRMADIENNRRLQKYRPDNFVVNNISSENINVGNKIDIKSDTNTGSTPFKINIKAYDETLKKFVMRASVLGAKVKELTTACNHKIYLISKSIDNHFIVIPSNVEQLNGNNHNTPITLEIKKLSGLVKVMGGAGLKEAVRMFSSCEFNSIDLSEMITDNLEDVRFMFEYAKVDRLILFDTIPKVKDLRFMFHSFKTDVLNFKHIRVDKDAQISEMFNNCKSGIGTIDNRLLDEFSNRNKI